jgi:Tfp pilus assembly pilus retraction ATPase PilT
MPKKESDPWESAQRLTEALVSEKEINVPNFFSKKQVKIFSQLSALSVLYKQYLLRLQNPQETVTWLDILIENYKTLNKALDGKAVKLASKVATSSQSKVMLNLQRVKERFMGREEESE